MKVSYDDLSPKVNVTVRLEFELTYYDVTVQYVNHSTSKTTPFTAEIIYVPWIKDI